MRIISRTREDMAKAANSEQTRGLVSPSPFGTDLDTSKKGGRVRYMALAARIVAVGLALLVTAGASAASNSTATSWPFPSTGVFTCGWIAANPAAAAHWRVSCDPAGPPASASGNAVQSAAGVMPFANGCQWLPSFNGYIGPGVFTWSAYEYSNYWSWSLDDTLSYTWYVQKTDGTNYTHGTDPGGITSVGVPANVYRWGAQNTSSSSEQFYVCYSG